MGNHTDVVTLLNEQSIYSIYHYKNRIAHGAERDPTWFMTKKADKPYHLDYCFASTTLINESTSMDIGRYKDWIHLSDHMPLIVKNLAL